MSHIQNAHQSIIDELGDIDQWEYAGGDRDHHKKYFNLKFRNKNTKHPAQTDHCLCGHYIAENCYVYNSTNEEIKVLGNCCIKKFIPKSSRTCEDCGETHRNRKWNKCNDCVENICFECGKENNSEYKYCYACDPRTKMCLECDRSYHGSSDICHACSNKKSCSICLSRYSIDNKWNRCYNCVKKICFTCGIEKNNKYKNCYSCYTKCRLSIA